ncbi:MAG: hypothetical protein J5957_07535 [Prevotella sp.]|nr:hypothetical protein [Prevotella sp.]
MTTNNIYKNVLTKGAQILLIMFAPLLVVSCIEDDSVYGEDTMSIEISDVETMYNVMSFSGETLNINPTVTSSFPESDMEYEWSYFDYSKSTGTVNSDTLQATVICNDKNLSYESRLPDGDYGFFFKARSKSTGYTKAVLTRVYAASALSKGFYVLKETEEGNSDVDLYNADEKLLLENVFSTYMGKTIKGKPLHMDIVGNQSYLDSLEAVPAASNLMCITTQEGDVKWVRIRDCKIVKSFEDCHYEPIEGEIPYRTVRINQLAYYVTSNGVYTANINSGTGTFGEAVYNSYGSTHLTSTRFNQLIYWNPQTRSLGMIDGNGYSCSFLNRLTDYQQMIKYRPTYQQMDCLFMGDNMVNWNDQIIIVMQGLADPSQRVIYFVTTNMSQASLMAVRELDPSTNIAQAEKYAINYQQATLLYGLHGNKIYSLDLNNNSSVEEELHFEGLPANEQITYIANKYIKAGVNQFDYFVVGTQSGSTYKLYFYGMVGGKPDGNPVFTISGSGKMVNVEYTDPQLTRLVGSGILDD